MFSKKNASYLENIDFEKASDLISFQQIYDGIHKKSRLALIIIGSIVITIEILIAACFSGWVFSNLLFSISEWVIVLATLFCLFKVKFRKPLELYLTNYFSRCSIIILICSVILSISTWVIFLSFSGGTNKPYIFQIVMQVFITVIICLLLEGVIYLYLRNKVIAELAIFVEALKIPVFVKVVEKSIGFIIAIILVAMQFYRMNKFWITHSTSWMITTLIPFTQFILFILVILLLFILPIKVFYPEIVKTYLLKKYSEEFRKAYDFTKEEWYGEAVAADSKPIKEKRTSREYE